MSSDQYLRDQEAFAEANRRKEEFFKFTKDIEAHLGAIVADVGKVRIALEKWKQNQERHTIDGDGIGVILCDVSNMLDSVYTELNGP